MNKIKIFLGIAFIALTMSGCSFGNQSESGSNNTDPTHDHIWGEATYTWASDFSKCTAERVCTLDSKHKETETANSIYKVKTPSSCENDGVGRYTVNFQNASFVQQIHDVIISATGHDWGEPIYELTVDNKMHATRVCRNNEKHKEEEIVSGVYSIVSNATEDTDGVGRYTYTFTNTAFETQTIDVPIEKLDYARTPRISEDGKTITYGLYPQTWVWDSDLLSELNSITEPESNGWYLNHGIYYAKTLCKGQNVFVEYEHGEAYLENGQTCWFKCEPIIWNVLSNNGNDYFILSSVLLDTYTYASSSNNYALSDVRGWLNNEFYNLAFANGNSSIQKTNVDNSASTTDNPYNSYACSNTLDYVFLPSYQDYNASSYGFSSDDSSSRKCKTTDWARANGADYFNTSSCNLTGLYWTRSPFSKYNDSVWTIGYDGSFRTEQLSNYKSYCIRPAINVNIE